MTNQPANAEIGLVFEEIEPLRGQAFMLRIGDEELAFTLTEARLLKHYVPEIHPRPPFSLLFHCPDVRIVPQGSYTLAHDTLEVQDMFLVPVAGDANGVSYEAVYN